MDGSVNGIPPTEPVVVPTAEEVARLRREHRSYAREIENLRAGAKTVVDEIDTRELLKSLAKLAAQMLNADQAMVGVIEDDAVVLEASIANHQLQRAPDPHFDHSRGATPWVVVHRQPLICNDPSHDPRFGENYAARNVLGVPVLNHQGVVIGVIEVHDRRDGGLFTPDDLRAAQILAMQTSIGLGRARLFDQMTDWSRSLEMLLAFNGAINQHLHPPLLVRRLVENAARFLKADGGMAGLAVPSGDGGATIMISEAYWSRGKWHERPRHWDRHEGLPGHILENEFPYLSNDYQEDRLADRGLMAEFEVRRALSVPIKDSEDRLLGFFELHKYDGQSAFSWQDAAFLESLANTTAVAIQNAQLLKTLEIKSHQIQALSAFHVTRLEEERRHISRELHDEAGQVLIGIKLGLQVMARQLPPELPQLREELDRMRDLVNQSTRQLKDLAKRLRPPTLDQLGLDVAIRQLAFDHSARTGMTVSLDLHAPGARLLQSTEIALYRVAQEALTNVAKHSEATQIWVSLRSTTRGLEFILRDDGKGFDLASPRTGLGLLGMKERIDMLQGHFEIASQAGEGTSVPAVVPEP
jgi:signal transduction histidine kinase